MYPVLFFAFGIPIGAYGFFLTMAHLVGLGMLVRGARKKGERLGAYLDIAFAVIVLGILGSRAGYAFTHWNEFQGQPASLLNLKKGGLSFFGGFAPAFFGFLLVARFRKIPFLVTSDWLCPILPMALALTRLGCFLKGCCYGSPTSFFWGVRYTRLDSKVPQELLDLPLHPTQLGECLFLLLLALSLHLVQKVNRLPPGILATLTVLFYSLYRFFFDFLRGDLDRGFWGISWLAPTQAAAFLGIAASPFVAWVCLKLHQTQAPLSPEPFYKKMRRKWGLKTSRERPDGKE